MQWRMRVAISTVSSINLILFTYPHVGGIMTSEGGFDMDKDKENADIKEKTKVRFWGRKNNTSKESKKSVLGSLRSSLQFSKRKDEASSKVKGCNSPSKLGRSTISVSRNANDELVHDKKSSQKYNTCNKVVENYELLEVYIKKAVEERKKISEDKRYFSFNSKRISKIVNSF